MKTIILILSLFALSCTKQDVQRNQAQAQQTTNAFSAQITNWVKVNEAGLDRFSIKLTVNVSRADSATSIQVTKPNFSTFIDVPLKNGDNYVSDYSVLGTISATYVVKTVLISGKITYSDPFTINY